MHRRLTRSISLAGLIERRPFRVFPTPLSQPLFPFLSSNMPPISHNWDHSSSPAWNAAAPYHTRAALRQRTNSLLDRDAITRRHFESGGLQKIPDYFLHSPHNLRRGSTSSSDSSSSSFTSQRSSSTTATSQYLSESPSTYTTAKLHLPSVPTHPLPSELGALNSRLTRSHSRSRRPSLSLPAGLEASATTGHVASGLSKRPSVLDFHSQQPPLPRDPFAPLQLDPLRAEELDREPPLTLPRPWLATYSRSRANSLGHEQAALAHRLIRERSRSPQSRTYLPPVPTHLPGGTPGQDPQKTRFVEGLISAACIAIEVVWKMPDIGQAGFKIVNGIPSPVSPVDHHQDGALPLQHFIREVLKRSRSTCSTLQVALYYIHKSRNVIRERVRYTAEARMELRRMQAQASQTDLLRSPSLSPRMKAALIAKDNDPVACGRRMFLAALICASKFLQDRTYANRSWARISSLSIQEINANEKAFLEVLEYNLFVPPETFKSWTKRLQDLADKQAHRGHAAAGASIRRPRTSISVRGDGLYRSYSEYVPAPEVTEISRPSTASGIRFPLTPIDTPRVDSDSPSEADYSLPPLAAKLASLSRSHTEPRLQSEEKLPPLGPNLGGGGLGRLTLPPLATKIAPSTHDLDTRAFDLSTRAYDLSTHTYDATLDSVPRPPLANRNAAMHPSGRGDLRANDLDVDTLGRLPRPSLGDSRYPSTSLYDARLRSGSCSSLARIHNDSIESWQGGDNMVL